MGYLLLTVMFIVFALLVRRVLNRQQADVHGYDKGVMAAVGGAVLTVLVGMLRAVAWGFAATGNVKVFPEQNTPIFGIFNYRTGRVDDGLDTNGWYDDDKDW
ncbi:MAG: hypothetical protein GY807_13220 [Gammaproteobacteria bacterium]|nr:hypothetical protein [Gammaproteobacteria bacterium]